MDRRREATGQHHQFQEVDIGRLEALGSLGVGIGVDHHLQDSIAEAEEATVRLHQVCAGLHLLECNVRLLQTTATTLTLVLQQYLCKIPEVLLHRLWSVQHLRTSS